MRSLPASADVEKGVLSCLMQTAGEDLFAEALAHLPSAQVFHLPAHRLIYETMMEMADAHIPIDVTTLGERLISAQLIEKIGGAATLAEIYRFSATAAHFEHYLHILLQKFTLRRLIMASTDAITEAYEQPEEVEPLLDRAEQAILAIRESKDQRSFHNIKEEVSKVLTTIEEIFQNKGSVAGLTSGFKGLDRMTNGFKGGEMIVIAARPSMGKTALALNILEHVAIVSSKPVAFFSLEMPVSQLLLRLIGASSGVPVSKINGGFLAKGDFQRIMGGAVRLSASPFFIDDTPSLSILELRAKARRLKQKHNLALIAIDYLQLLRSTSRRSQDNRQLEIAEISAGLKALAKELDLPILVLAQLNRGPENRGGRPRLSDLRESGSIEQDADVVGLLLRKKYYSESTEDAEEAGGESELLIAKNRNGATGEVPLTFLEEIMRFADRAEEDDRQK